MTFTVSDLINPMDESVTMTSDSRQRFYIDNSPVRGEMVHLDHTLNTILAQRQYPQAISLLLGEMLAAVALLASTLKFKGRLSIQAQGEGALTWAMAECSHLGEMRALAKWDNKNNKAAFASDDANLAFAELGQNRVLFINIEPEHGQRYQGIIPIEANNLAGCLASYYDWSAQTPTLINLSCDGKKAAGILVQLLPRSTTEEQEFVDSDLWPRITALTVTLQGDELRDLPTIDILHRLYHEEDVMLSDAESLKFGCTCSREKCEGALLQLGKEAVFDILKEQLNISMDCEFCNTNYCFDKADALSLFADSLSDQLQ